MIKKPTLQELYEIMETEGIGYALSGYQGKIDRCIDDAEFTEIWNNAVDALKKVQTHIKTKLSDGTLEFFEY
jgi:hypothetical protein